MAEIQSATNFHKLEDYMNLFNEDNKDEDEDDYPEPDIAVCTNCGGDGCSSCDYDGVVDRNWLEPDGTN